MDKNSIEEYKREMMKLYGKNSFDEKNEDIINPEKNENLVEEKNKINDEMNYSANERYPEPDLSEFDLDISQINTLKNDIPKETNIGNSIGYILVNTRTGEESSPVSGASVLITAIVDGQREMIAFGKTDDSGVSPKFSVPAPDSVYSEKQNLTYRPYSLFDVSVVAKGFFNARSVDVPVFSGITSIQDFAMIPVPLMMKSGDETVTYMNQEPDFPSEN